MNERLIESIRTHFEATQLDELKSIYLKHDTSAWSDEAFEAIRRILQDRGQPLPLFDPPHDQRNNNTPIDPCHTHVKSPKPALERADKITWLVLSLVLSLGTGVFAYLRTSSPEHQILFWYLMGGTTLTILRRFFLFPTRFRIMAATLAGAAAGGAVPPLLANPRYTGEPTGTFVASSLLLSAIFLFLSMKRFQINFPALFRGEHEDRVPAVAAIAGSLFLGVVFFARLSLPPDFRPSLGGSPYYVSESEIVRGRPRLVFLEPESGQIIDDLFAVTFRGGPRGDQVSLRGDNDCPFFATMPRNLGLRFQKAKTVEAFALVQQMATAKEWEKDETDGQKERTFGVKFNEIYIDNATDRQVCVWYNDKPSPWILRSRHYGLIYAKKGLVSIKVATLALEANSEVFAFAEQRTYDLLVETNSIQYYVLNVNHTNEYHIEKAHYKRGR